MSVWVAVKVKVIEVLACCVAVEARTLTTTVLARESVVDTIILLPEVTKLIPPLVVEKVNSGVLEKLLAVAVKVIEEPAGTVAAGLAVTLTVGAGNTLTD